jgi:hypothetical protein
MFSLPKILLKRRQNELDHARNVIDTGFNFSRQAFEYLEGHPEFQGLFLNAKAGKDGFQFIYRRVAWIDPNSSSESILSCLIHHF